MGTKKWQAVFTQEFYDQIKSEIEELVKREDRERLAIEADNRNTTKIASAYCDMLDDIATTALYNNL